MMKVEFRGKNTIHISGYVNAVERFSSPITDNEGRKFIEKIASGTFAKAIEQADDIGVMLNHEKPLTTVRNGEITLKEDSIGLFFDGDITDEETVQRARNRELVGWSFGFRATGQTDRECETAGIDYERTIDSMELLEVSIIDIRKKPCYPATSISARAEPENTIELRAKSSEIQYVVSEKARAELELRKRKLALKSK